MPVTVDPIKVEVPEAPIAKSYGRFAIASNKSSTTAKGNPWKKWANKELVEAVWAFKEESEIECEIAGVKYYLKGRLKPIGDALIDAQEMLELEDDWDENGAIATDNQTFNKAASFVVDYCTWILKHCETVIVAPVFDLMKDGGILVQFQSENGKFYIVFKKNDDERAYYFAERKTNKVPIKSAIINGGPVDAFLSRWMGETLS